MTKSALVILSDGFEDIEAVAPIDVLNRAGVEVTTASLKEGPVRGAYGCTLLPSTSLTRVSGLFDAIVLPGGKINAENLSASPMVTALIREHLAAGRIIAAICASPALVLARAAAILKGCRATGTPEMNDILTASGAIVTGEAVTCDGSIITAMGPGAALAFGLKLAERLTGSSVPEVLAAKWQVSY